MGWRERYGAVGTEEAPARCVVAARRATRRALAMPDATGLELLAQELGDATRVDTVHFRERATADRRPGADPRDARPRCAPRAMRSSRASTASTTTPRSRASASLRAARHGPRRPPHASSSACPATRPHVGVGDPRLADGQPPGARGLRHVRRGLRRPPRPAADPHARGLRGTSRSGATSRSAASPCSSPTTRPHGWRRASERPASRRCRSTAGASRASRSRPCRRPRAG